MKVWSLLFLYLYFTEQFIGSFKAFYSMDWSREEILF